MPQARPETPRHDAPDPQAPELRCFAPDDPAALLPAAFGGSFSKASAEPASHGAIAVVPVRGPLMHHAAFWWDSYEGIRSRVAAALDEGARAVVLSIDSPGGLVSGCFETAEALRAMVDERDAQLFAYVDGQATSAAYALAAAADRIFIPPTGAVGSIGVLAGMASYAQAFEAFGIAHRFVTTGSRKLDGAPQLPIDDAAVSALQARVNAMGEVFFAHVTARRGVSVSTLRGLEGAVIHGQAAVDAQLADQVVTSFDQALADVASRISEEDSMSMKTIAAALALASTADEATVLSAVQRRSGLIEQLGQRLGLKAGTSHEEILASAAERLSGDLVPKAHLEAVQGQLAVLEQQIEAGRRAAHAQAVEATLEAGRKAGKIPPAAIEHYRTLCATPEGLTAVKATIEALPSLTTADPTNDDTPPKASVAGLTDTQRVIARRMGMTPDEYAKALAETEG